MKNALLLTIALLFPLAGFAEQDPCAPTESNLAPPIHCYVNSRKSVDIELKAFSTPSNGQCAPENRISVFTATVNYQDSNLKTVRTERLDGGDFEFDWGQPGVGGAWFISHKKHLNLIRNCVSPVYGAVSHGN